MTRASAHECSTFIPMRAFEYTTSVIDLSNQRSAPEPWMFKWPCSESATGAWASSTSTNSAVSIMWSVFLFRWFESSIARASAQRVLFHAVNAATLAAGPFSGFDSASALMWSSWSSSSPGESSRPDLGSKHGSA
eukprot:Amastigsp_a4096_38.p5 type:complete len:135 gc:universal Amastigsp_a4096_38:1520-1116(-)